jgi:O-antigen/teichoic acid export membrane protein
MLRHLLGLRLLITVFGTAAAVLFAVAAGYDTAMVAGTAVAGAGVVIAIVQGTYTIPLQSALRLGWVAAIDVLRQTVTVVAIVAFAVAGASIVPLLGAPVVAALATLAATYALVRGAVPLLPSVDWAHFRRLLAITAPYAVATAVGVIYSYVAVVLMSLVSTERETGFFGASFRVFAVLGGLTGPLIASAFPILVRAASTDRNRLAYGLQRLWEIALLVGAGLSVVTAIGAPTAIDVVAGPDYEPSVSVLRIQALGLVATYVLATWGFALLSLTAYRALLVSNALALLTSAGITLAVAPSHGAVGTAFATLAGETLLAGAYGVALMRSRPELRVKLGVVPKVALAAAASCVPLLVPLPDVARLVLAALAYSTIVLVLRAVPPDVWHAVRGGTRRG